MAKTVAVLKGGWSAEREVSLVSGAAVAAALAERGNDVVEIDVTRDLTALVAALTPAPDIVFNALHGHGGEDGHIQALLGMMGLKYTHSGLLASAIAMNKVRTKEVLAAHGVVSPAGLVVPTASLREADPLPRPYIVKPIDEGSTVGVHLVRPGDNAPPGDGDSRLGETCLAEEYIRGHELTVGVMGDRALDVTQINYTAELFDYTAKYSEGFATHILPAPVPDAIYREAKRLAVLAHHVLGCDGISRSDFRWDDSRPGVSGLYFLEINTQPGFTPLSLVPEQAARQGIPFGDLCDWLVETARWHPS